MNLRSIIEAGFPAVVAVELSCGLPNLFNPRRFVSGFHRCLFPNVECFNTSRVNGPHSNF
jgi:hypothetical protein